MAKHVLSFLIKIVLFAVIMMTVAKTIHYDAQVNSFIANHFSYDDVNNIGKWVLGEPDPEPYDSVSFFIVFLSNILISVAILSVATTAYTAFTGTASPLVLLKKFSTSTLRRIIKIFAFTFVFWALFRFLPYQSLFPDGETYSAFTYAAVIAFNLIMTIICYFFIQKQVTTKRSL
ncbi:hypothetical protein [Pseudescherichia sp.]|uniref:hypothetical protein n=1 Tax=Pseudescherichia sp. TaxID=2055881 RepID=UPI00289B92BB|nr:hypothetical protein [Pseudescherichia sp.]